MRSWLHTIIHPLDYRSLLFNHRSASLLTPDGNAKQGVWRPSQAWGPLWCAASWPPAPQAILNPCHAGWQMANFSQQHTRLQQNAKPPAQPLSELYRRSRTESWGTLLFRLTLKKGAVKENSLQQTAQSAGYCIKQGGHISFCPNYWRNMGKYIFKAVHWYSI